jgi:threonine dehydrogenase-like Zn-dependent dehydrogenase
LTFDVRTVWYLVAELADKALLSPTIHRTYKGVIIIMNTQEGYRVAVVGIGAMGGGMARALLVSSACKSVAGYDRSVELVDAFHDEAKALPTYQFKGGSKRL